MNEKVISNFKILIGQDSVSSIPIGDPYINFIINDRWTAVRLDDFQEWINTIANSKGDRNEKAYEAKRQLDSLFKNLLFPFMILDTPRR